MYALSSHIVCLLVAQFGPDSGFPADPPPVTPPVVRSVVPAATVDLLNQQPLRTPERTAPPVANTVILASTVPVHSQKSLARAEALVEQFVGWDPDAIEGESFTLLACVQRAATTGQQSATIRAYWQLCSAIGRYSQAEQGLVTLAGIYPQLEFEQLQIRAAQRSAAAHRAQTRVELLTAQEKLGEVAKLPDETLPLPADRPFVGKYQTRLTTMYARRAIPRQLRKIDRALPHQLKLIEQRADAVDANSRLLSDLAALHQRGQVPLSVLLHTCRELLDQQNAFLHAVVNYNHQIATYSQAVVGVTLPSESLVSTLIRQSSAATARIIRDENVRPAAAEQIEPSSVRPAFEPRTSQPAFEPRTPKANGGTAFDPNSAFPINDAP
ncbi:MAG TPA: hypothetical protein QF564_27435 [Pirellulaceae bacterium]|jgi:hypothetical protein|nr:hypothetical protein [Pirellulaceae bacterium]